MAESVEDSRAGDGTTLALLDAAEAAFAEHGTENVSLRAIMRQAGVNPAAVHYHYGSRDGLTKAVVDRVLGPLQARRLDLLDLAVAAAGKGGPTVEALLAAIVRPDLEAMVAVGARNPDGAQLIGAVYNRPSDFVKRQVERSFAPVAARFMPHMLAAVPNITPQDLSWRVRWAVFGLLGALLSDDETVITAENLEDELARIVLVTSGALAASSPKST